MPQGQTTHRLHSPKYFLCGRLQEKLASRDLEYSVSTLNHVLTLATAQTMMLTRVISQTHQARFSLRTFALHSSLHQDWTFCLPDRHMAHSLTEFRSLLKGHLLRGRLPPPTLKLQIQSTAPPQHTYLPLLPKSVHSIKCFLTSSILSQLICLLSFLP